MLRFEVVLSSGAVVDVDSQSHTGLFCALKGGTNNFGIVTRLDLNVVPQGKLWGGSIITDIANRPAIFEFLEKFVQEEAFDRRASIFADTAWTSGRGYFMITYPVYTKPIENPPFFAPLLDLPKPIEKTTRIDTMKGFTDQLTTFNPPGRRCDQGSFTSAPSAAFMESYFQMFSKAVESVKDIPGLVMVSIFQPQSRQIVAQSKARGPNSLGLDETDGDLVNVFSFASYNDARYDERVHEAIKRLISNGEKEAARMGVLKDFIYMNYAGPWQDVIGSYGKANVDAMKKVSKAYDPIQLFQHAVPSAFKLPKTEGHGGADSRL